MMFECMFDLIFSLFFFLYAVALCIAARRWRQRIIIYR